MVVKCEREREHKRRGESASDVAAATAVGKCLIVPDSGRLGGNGKREV